jgi:hypothetical protein
MYACYLMGALTYTLFVLAGLQGIFGFPVLGAPHPTFSFLTAIIYFFTQTLTIFFFVGTATNIREYLEAAAKADPKGPAADLVARARHLRGAVSGQIYLNILLFLIQAILGGAVAASAVPRFLHGTLVAVAFVHFHYVMWREHLAFRDMTALVVEMTGGSPGQPDTAAGG